MNLGFVSHVFLYIGVNYVGITKSDVFFWIPSSIYQPVSIDGNIICGFCCHCSSRSTFMGILATPPRKKALFRVY